MHLVILTYANYAYLLYTKSIKYELYPSIQVAASRISEYYTNISLCNAYSLMRGAATSVQDERGDFILHIDMLKVMFFFYCTEFMTSQLPKIIKNGN